MELTDLAGMVNLCHRNIHKLQNKLVSYEHEVDAVGQALNQRWVKMDCVDGRLIALHDRLLSSLSDVNEYVIKLILHINLNCPGKMIPSSDREEYVKHTNKDGIEVQLDMDDEMQSYRRPSIQPSLKQSESQCQSPNLRNKKLVTEHMLVPRSLNSFSKPPKDVITKTVSEEYGKTTSKDFSEENSVEMIAPLPTHTNSHATVEKSETIDKDAVIPILSSVKKAGSAPISVKNPETKPKEENVTTPVRNDASSPTRFYTPEKKDIVNTTSLSPMKELPKPSSTPTSPSGPLGELLQLPLKMRQRLLLHPRGGTEINAIEVYNNVKKNIDKFPKGSVCKAFMMHLNIADNCFYVAAWDNCSKPVQKLLAGEIPLLELEQLPDFGEMFAIYDSQGNIIPRVIINSYTEGGGYDAYLVDYGEHIHLNGKEIIFDLPQEIKQLPAQAIKCYLINDDVAKMSNFTYQEVILRIMDNDGNNLQVEILKSQEDVSETNPPPGIKLTEEELNMLEEIEEGTSSAVKAVLGYKPKDDQRLCRHYDPNLNGCFKGATCRLVHEPPAPFGGTKDVELVPPLLESTFDSSLPKQLFELGSSITIEVTYISSPTQVYAQIMNGSPAMIWTKKEVTESNRKFTKKPCILDVVLAYYSDNCYYRAQIIDDFGEGEYKIFYVDYGNTEFVSIKSLAPCGTENSLKPYRAISWHIENVVRKPMLSIEKISECIEYLKSKILNMEIEVKITRQLPDAWVIRFLGDYADVPNQLVKRGYVLPNEGLTREGCVQIDYNEKPDSSCSDF